MSSFDDLHQVWEQSKIKEIIDQEEEYKENGYWKERNSKGAIIAEGNYKDGLKEGEWNFYQLDQLALTCHFISGEKEGAYKTYDYGKVREEGNYLKSRKHGMIVEYIYPFASEKDKDKSLVASTGEYYHGFKKGRWTEFDRFTKESYKNIADDFHEYLYSEGSYMGTTYRKQDEWNTYKVTSNEFILIRQEKYKTMGEMESFEEYYDNGNIKIKAECYTSVLASNKNGLFAALDTQFYIDSFFEYPILKEKITYFEDGNIESAISYELSEDLWNPKIIKLIKYDNNGNVLEEIK